jgi:cytochrome c-type biogenesis protein CcmE
MAEHVWEKPNIPVSTSKSSSQYLKFIIGGLLMLVAVVYLIISGTTNGARYFMTIDNLLKSSEYVGKSVRMSGAVIGDTIVYDKEKLTIDFTIANIPEDTTDLARILHEAVTDPSAKRIKVHVENQVMPDLLKNEAQAILTGKLGEDGVFYASELLLKCPSRYDEAVPDQSQGA